MGFLTAVLASAAYWGLEAKYLQPIPQGTKWGWDILFLIAVLTLGLLEHLYKLPLSLLSVAFAFALIGLRCWIRKRTPA
jgi:hypothetical protein